VIGLALYYARDKGVAFPSQRTLAEKLGLGVKTIIKYNRVLEANGLIKIERKKGKGKTNLVTLLKVENVSQVQTKENNMKENTIEVNAKASPIDVIDYFKRRVKELKDSTLRLIMEKMVGSLRRGLRNTLSMRLEI
jgi:DNA-binding transcriptional regulator YhcF (GntR family)